MAKFLWIFLSYGFLFFGFHFSQAQGHGPVIWRFAAGPLRANETTLYISASLAPGWHLYSQFLREGGPIPTRFEFVPSEDYVLNGVTRESGIASHFYDDTYEMEITWYSEDVRFEQNVRLDRPATRIKGKVKYMTCNKDMCIPAEREFYIDVNP